MKKKTKQPSHGEKHKGIKKEERPIPKTPEEAAKTFPWMGRYDETIPAKLIEHLRMGFSFESFGGVASVGISTLKRWVHEYPDFAQAKEIGESQGLRTIEQLAMAKSRGKIVKDDDGKEQFNPRLADGKMISFLLKTRFHKVYGEKVKIDHGSEDGSMTPKPTQVSIYLPANGRTKEENDK